MQLHSSDVCIAAQLHHACAPVHVKCLIWQKLMAKHKRGYSTSLYVNQKISLQAGWLTLLHTSVFSKLANVTPYSCLLQSDWHYTLDMHSSSWLDTTYSIEGPHQAVITWLSPAAGVHSNHAKPTLHPMVPRMLYQSQHPSLGGWGTLHWPLLQMILTHW